MPEWFYSLISMLIIPIAVGFGVGALFYHRAGKQLDERMDRLDRLIHQLARVVKDPKSITLNNDGSLTFNATASATQGQSASADAVVIKAVTEADPETVDKAKSDTDQPRQ